MNGNNQNNMRREINRTFKNYLRNEINELQTNRKNKMLDRDLCGCITEFKKKYQHRK
jgi:hypothetical protein